MCSEFNSLMVFLHKTNAKMGSTTATYLLLYLFLVLLGLLDIREMALLAVQGEFLASQFHKIYIHRYEQECL